MDAEFGIFHNMLLEKKTWKLDNDIETFSP